MNAQELRIGNWVRRFSENGRHIQYEKVEIIPMHKLQSSYIEPILLTEEILLKCKDIICNNLCFFRIILNDWSEIHIDFSGKSYAVSISINKHGYVIGELTLHQLQNLFFVLTGEELEINL